MCAVNWIKLDLGMLDDPQMRVIDKMAEKDVIECVWIKLLILSGKVNDGGRIYMDSDLPYSLETLSMVLNRSEYQVKLSLDTLVKLKMITIDDDDIITIKNWAKYQSVDEIETAGKQSKQPMRKMGTIKKAEKQNKDVCVNAANQDESSYVTVTEQDENGYVTVTQQDEGGYVTVTPKNKRENKNKNKDIDININKKERDKEKDKNKNDSLFLEEKNNIVTLEDKKIEKANETAIDKAIEGDKMRRKDLSG